MNPKIMIALLIAILFRGQVAIAGDGTSAVDFLNIGVSARTAGTGEALAVLSDGPIASYYNPAGLTTVDYYQVAGMHSEWFQDLRYEFLGFSAPIGQKGGIGFSASYLSLGSISAYSDNNTAIGSVGANDWSFGLAYGHRLTPSLSLGGGLRMVGEKLDDVETRALAGDIGLQYHGYSYALGMAFLNVGPAIKYDQSSSPMPTRYDIGFSYLPLGDRLALLAGMSVPFHGHVGFKTGLEYTYAGILTFRSGYSSADRFDNRGGISLGAGFNIMNNSLDYAYNVNNVLGGTHQISFVLRFGQSADQNQVSVPPPPAPEAVQNHSAAQSDSSSAPPKKAVYLVCAGRYNTMATAEKHMETLKKFGYSPTVNVTDQNEYRVVMARVKEMEKAEKIRADYEKRGLSCFIETE